MQTSCKLPSSAISDPGPSKLSREQSSMECPRGWPSAAAKSRARSRARSSSSVPLHRCMSRRRRQSNAMEFSEGIAPS